MDEQKEKLWNRLEKWQRNSESKMTKDRYLEMKDQLGEEPDPEECPPGFEDFPEIVAAALNTFNSLGNRVYPEIGYTGKDYTSLPQYMKIYSIEEYNEGFFLDILLHLDARAIEQAQKDLKKELDKMKRKNG